MISNIGRCFCCPKRAFCENYIEFDFCFAEKGSLADFLGGEGMAFKPGVAGKIFTILGENKVNIRAIAQGSSELNISCVITRKDLKKAVQCLTQEFNLTNNL